MGKEEDIIEMAQGGDGTYEPIPEAKRRRAERVYNNRGRGIIQEPPQRSFRGTYNLVTRPQTNPPVTFLEGFGEGLKIVVKAKREFEKFLINIMEGD